MLLAGDLGFQSLILLISLVFPVFGFIIRRKWRLALARKKEIKRLSVLASEEAARVELEASIGYDVVSTVPRHYECAVCYNPTTTRCSQCKAVRYCSGKCQIIHWRQGHKEECCPPCPTKKIIDAGNGYCLNLSKEENYEIYSDKLNGTRPVKPIEKSHEQPAFPSLSVAACEKDDKRTFESLIGNKETNSTFESSSESLFSGLSTSTSVSQIFDDVSIRYSSDSAASDRLGGQLSANSTFDLLQTTFGVADADHSKPVSPKFATLVESGNGFPKLSQPNQLKHNYDDEETQRPSTFASGVSNNVLDCHVSDFPYGFWGRAGKTSYPQSSLHLPLNLSASTSPVLPTQGCREKDSLSDDVGPDTEISDPTGAANLSENVGIHVPKIRDAEFLKCETSDSLDNEPRIRSQNVKSRDVKPISLGNERISRCAGPLHADLHSVSNSPSAKNGLKTSIQKVMEQFRAPKISKNCHLGARNDIAGKYNDKGLFTYELFVKLYNWNNLELCPAGILNCGNSCYANAVLQCLVFTPPLTAYFLQGHHSKACLKKDWCFTCEFESLISKAKKGRSPLSSIGIISQLQNNGSQLGSGTEEDAHEFLSYAIETMQSVCLKEAGINASGTLEEETTLIGLTFGGYLWSKIKCSKCQGKSERQERMMDLTVEIEGDIATLEEALQQFTSTEILDGDNKYHCDRCKTYEKAKKKLTILEAPNILTIALKRFQSGKFGKLNKPIKYPEILYLAPFMSGTSDKSPIYRLYAVVVHLDIMNAAFSGHYVCYVKNVQNKWFKVDDSTVTPVELEAVLTKGAYMLLYARCSPRAPKLTRNRMATRDPKTRAMPSFINGKTASLKSISISTNSSVAQWLPGSNVPPEGSTNFESDYSRFHQLQRILEEDSSSDNSSLSSNSDEGSCSTDSTRDSTSTEDLSD